MRKDYFFEFVDFVIDAMSNNKVKLLGKIWKDFIFKPIPE